MTSQQRNTVAWFVTLAAICTVLNWRIYFVSAYGFSGRQQSTGGQFLVAVLVQFVVVMAVVALWPRRLQEVEDCECCRIASRLGREYKLYRIGKYWTLNDDIRKESRLVVQLVRHVPRFDELTRAESSELGLVLQKIARCLPENPQGEDFEVAYQNQLGHVHVHIHQSGSGDNTRFRSAKEIAEALVPGLTARSPALKTAQYLIRTWDRFGLYGWISGYVNERYPAFGPQLGDWYGFFWLLIVAASFVAMLQTKQVAVHALLLAIVAYRLIDLLVTHLRPIIRAAPTLFHSLPRRFILLYLNVVELWLIVATMLAAENPNIEPLKAAFNLVSLVDGVDAASSGSRTVIEAVARVTALLLFGGVFSMFLGSISQRHTDRHDRPG